VPARAETGGATVYVVERLFSIGAMVSFARDVVWRAAGCASYRENPTE
jgi:hypothetical protein